MIKQRQKENIEIAKKAGKFKGRKLEVTEGGKKAQKAPQAIEWYKESKSINLLGTSVRRC
jgi:DNA invertase Pin-like site-specific DNA recombinase